MKKNIKAFIVIVVLGLASVFTACKSPLNDPGKTPANKTNPASGTPGNNPSSNDSDLTQEPADLPLTFQVVTAGKIVLTGKEAFEKFGIQKNDGLIVEPADNISVQPGDIIRFYGKNYKYAQTGAMNLTINSTATCYVYGNIMSLVEYTDFAEKTEIKQNYALQKLFMNNIHIKNHETLDIILPATTLSEYCYKQMFSGCIGITKAPELPAQTLAKGCYKSMFSDCTGITKAPDLLAPVLVQECYGFMFSNCTKLNYIKCLATNIKAADSTKNWIVNVSSSGSFIGTHGSNIWIYKDKTSGIPSGWESDPAYAPVDAKQLPLTLEAEEDNTIITISGISNGESNFKNLKYSINGGEKKAATSEISLVNAGDRICFFAEGPRSASNSSNYTTINCSKDCYIYGNIMSLLDPENFSTKINIEKYYTFQWLFKYNTHIKNISIDLVLPATTLTQYCYQYMFSGCTGLTSVPELPATTMQWFCYYHMFSGCKGLTTMPELPATTVAQYCYADMFSNCTGLTTLSKLPATTFGSSDTYCYKEMFLGCTGLTTVPESFLPAATVTSGCCKSMFEGCTSLTTVHELPATTVMGDGYKCMFKGCTSLATPPKLSATNLTGTGCYESMFEGCTSLTCAPELPADNIPEGGYRSMFSGCTNLTTAPELPATTIGNESYKLMFENCTNLSAAPVLQATTTATNCYNSMFKGCSRIKTIECLVITGTVPKNLFTGVNTEGLLISPDPSFWTENIPSGYNWTVEKDLPLSFDVIQEGTISVTNPAAFTNLQYSKNFGAKISVSASDSISVVEGDTISFYAKGRPSSANQSSNTIYCTINCSSDCAVYGNIMSLDSPAGYADETTFRGKYIFRNLFKNNTHLKNHSSKQLTLPATTLTDECYWAMFEGCSALTAAPKLPATNLRSYCYFSMFKGCTSLTTAPELPATDLYANCYQSMFEGCTSLTNPPELKATTVSYYGYKSMFAGCTSLKTAPALPATTLDTYCYQLMFSNCTSLTEAPELPAQTLKSSCYSGMFSGCTSLTKAPDLPAKTLLYSCYDSMFSGCTNLNYIKCLATDISASKCTYCWLSDVSSTGTFVKSPAMQDWTTGVLGIPSGWTVQNATN